MEHLTNKRPPNNLSGGCPKHGGGGGGGVSVWVSGWVGGSLHTRLVRNRLENAKMPYKICV